MKRTMFGWTIAAFVLMVLLGACISIQDKAITTEEIASTEVVGKVSTTFISVQPGHYQLKDSIKKKAYDKLLAVAKKEYMGKYDVTKYQIRNIRIEGKRSNLHAIPPWVYGLFMNIQKCRATGDVVIFSADTRSNVTAATKGIEGAIYRIAEKFAGELPDNAKVAILSVSSKDADSIIEELEFWLDDLGSNFTIVDRRAQEQIRKEQSFQMSGNVSDDSAVEIGNMLGATIVITGSQSGSGTNNRLTFRALDVKTAQLLVTVREQF